MYVICNEYNHYITTKKKKGYAIVPNLDKAHRWDNLDKAQNFLTNNCTCPELKPYTWRVIQLVNGTEIIPDEMESLNVEPVEMNCDILDTIRNIGSFTRQLEQRKLYLINQLKQTDLEIVDIEHAAEFYNLNASQGYKLYKMLHNARIKRREIKDELQIIGYTLTASLSTKSMEHLESSILGLDNRQYAPRVHKELFGV